MSRKYDIRICKCGRIHAIPNERIKNALNADKNFLLICAACGNATLIGADISPDWDDPTKDFFEASAEQNKIREKYYTLDRKIPTYIVAREELKSGIEISKHKEV